MVRIGAALDPDALSIDQAVSHLLMGGQQNALKGGPGNLHLFGAGALLQPFKVFQSDRFKLFDQQGVTGLVRGCLLRTVI